MSDHDITFDFRSLTVTTELIQIRYQARELKWLSLSFVRRRQNIQQIHAQDAEGPLSKAEKPVASMVTIEMTGSNIDTTSATEHCHKKGDNHLTWQRVSTIMDRAFFVIFVLISLTSYAVYTADAL